MTGREWNGSGGSDFDPTVCPDYSGEPAAAGAVHLFGTRPTARPFSFSGNACKVRIYSGQGEEARDDGAWLSRP